MDLYRYEPTNPTGRRYRASDLPVEPGSWSRVVAGFAGFQLVLFCGIGSGFAVSGSRNEIALALGGFGWGAALLAATFWPRRATWCWWTLAATGAVQTFAFALIVFQVATGESAACATCPAFPAALSIVQTVSAVRAILYRTDDLAEPQGRGFEVRPSEPREPS